MEIVNTYTETTLTAWACAVIVVSGMMTLLLVGAMLIEHFAGEFGKRSILKGVFALGFVVAIVVAMLTGKVENHIVEMKLTKEASYLEINEKYEFKNKRGDIYVFKVKEKE